MSTRSALFHRCFERYSGGHQKVLDYFGHCVAHSDWMPRIYWAPGSLDMESTVWAGHLGRTAPEFDPVCADLVFLAGMDWAAYLPVRSEKDQPVINLIQHVRHAAADSDVYPFLRERAIRICVSSEVADKIAATNRVNGPVFTIANGLDRGALAGIGVARRQQVYILGNKQPELAHALANCLRKSGFSVLLSAEHVEHAAVLTSMAQARVSVLLPHAEEGFYLPALEAMALSEMVVVPDCVGNRSFCQHGENCLMPALELDALLASTQQAVSLIESGAAASFRQRGRETLAYHSLERERQAFYDILDNLDQIW